MNKDLSNLREKLQALLLAQRDKSARGNVADYIPALAEVDPNLMGAAIATIDGDFVGVGDYQHAFSIQSISKVFGLVMAMNRVGDALWQRVNMEPSGQPFNSIIQLEWEKGIPRNPVINAGAILISDVLVSHYSASKLAFISFLRTIANDEDIHIDHDVFQSELAHGNRNAALAYLMKSFNNIEAEVPDVLEHYFTQCSVTMNCQQLAQSLLFLANKGVNPLNNTAVCTRKEAHRVNAILSTSGMYDQSGEFAFSVGLPAKSGVGGGIVAIVPNFGVICAWSPPLNSFGNSVVGMNFIAGLAEELGLSIY
ncbi:glutaminase [Thalassotalea sp. 1_MG-2023]|uniref:glutaminase n=1 Tax=Thalassotalea sp. 1_MG-2023 TaxID=3062680 RepID=UPI0026E25239|nr:glutaminase [Thalassotalea sp. 1_MG-2023]MDO6427388.1 glutaminase [Thalassotalea sp. 1_MG-2023]